MIHRLIVKQCFVILLIFLSFKANAQIIDNIEVKGSSDFSQSDYTNWINLKNKKYFESVKDTVIKRISLNIKQNGYFNFQIDSVLTKISADTQKVGISVYLNEENPTIVNSISIQNLDSVEQKSVYQKFELLLNSPFIIGEFENTFADLLTEFENNGFPFASINIESLFFYYDSTEHENLVDVSLNFSKNEISTIDTIIVQGNSKTKNYVITRELRIEKGETYNQEKMDEIPDKLNRLRFFEQGQNPKFFFNSQNKGVLQIDVNEINTNSFDGVLGYIPATNDKEDGYFTGLANINLRNLLGTGRSLSFKWSKLDRNSQELEVKYLEPWVLDLPINVGLMLFQRQQDTTYIQRILNANIEFLATESFSSSLIFSQEYTIPTNPEVRGFTVFNSISTNSGVNFKYDSRDDIFVPTKGFYFLNTYKYSAKKIIGPEMFVTEKTNKNPDQFKVEFDLFLFKSIFTRHIPFVSLHLRELRGDDIEISDMYRFGGNNTLRGYQESQFTGNRLLWTNVEYRYLLGRRSYVFLFTDIAYYKRNEISAINLTEFSATKIGYGAGITFETALGMLAVSYAIAQGDAFNKGKIHFGLIGEF